MSSNGKYPSQQKEFQYGRSIIEYALVREDRDNMAITVRPDKTVLVKAPSISSLEEIQIKLKNKGQWVLKQINYFDKFHPLQPTPEYISGETHYYLGRQYRLRIKKGSAESVKLIGKFFIVKTKNPKDRAAIKNLMLEWYAIHAQGLIDRRVKLYVDDILGSDFEELTINYRVLKSRWGSYSLKTGITFNIELVKTPIQCVDYVIVHELCHVVQPNHDKTFYKLMRRIFPDWRTRKEKLELFGVR